MGQELAVFRYLVCLLWVSGSAVSTAHAERIGAFEPRLEAEPGQFLGSWQTKRDYTKFPVSRAIALPDLAEAELETRLYPAKPGAPVRIGMARNLPEEYRGDLAKTAQWTDLPEAGQVTSFIVRSPDAEALRLRMQASLPDGARIRFFEGSNPDRRYPILKASDFISERGPIDLEAAEFSSRTRWSPSVSGESVGIEIEIPPSADVANVSFRIVRVSHIWRSPLDASSSRLLRKSNAACSPVEVACKSLPSCTSRAVAGIEFTQEDGQTYVCTGTAVNSFRSEFENSDNPFLLTADHCVSSDSAADSVVSYWHHEHEACGGTSLHPDFTKLQGGADLMTSDPDSDGSLLRLRDGLPNSACLAGWDANGGWRNGTEVSSLHHPGGEVKEWAGGSIERTGVRQVDNSAVDTIDVVWTEGSTRPGSSGSGLFTSNSDGEDALIGLLSAGPADDCTRDSYGRLDRFFGTHAGVHLVPTNPPLVDDHGGTADDATGVLIGSETRGEIDDGSDADVFRLVITEPGTLTVYSTGTLDTVGRLKRENGSTVDFDDDGGFEGNFKIEVEVTAGTYYVKVTGYNHTQKGTYRLHVEFLAAAGAKKVLVPLFLSASARETEKHQGFVRVFNRSGRAGEVRVTATDDGGQNAATITLSIEPNQTRPFNSQDLEQGNPEKGLSSGIGAGMGDWRLEFESDLEIEVAAYVRTEDGFLTSMHDQVIVEERTGAHHVPAFNPASNTRQRSMLRLINPNPDSAVDIKITGYDDDGEMGQSAVELRLPAGTARTFDSVQLENGDENLAGRLGDGKGKWRLFIEAEGKIYVVNLLDSATGNLTNLSLPGGDNYSQ